MPDGKFSEITTQSWFSRIGKAFIGIIFGLILFGVSLILLFWNEGRAVKQAKTLQEGKSQVQSISTVVPNPAYNQKLVHFFGKADTEEILKDAEFDVQDKFLKLSRTVEMYQWEEKRQSHSQKNVGGSETTEKIYTYAPDWSERLISSDKFRNPNGHVNPKAMAYSSQEYIAKEIKVGAFLLSEGLKRQINDWVNLDTGTDSALPANLQGKMKKFDGFFYSGVDPQNPQIGDLRVSFKAVFPGEVTVVAKQLNNTFEPYRTSVGGDIEMLRSGTHSAEEMFELAKTDNIIITWLVRIGGFFLMFIGLAMLLNPLSVLADFIPFLGNVIGVGTGLVALLLSLVFSFLTIAAAWLIFRPLLGILFICAAAGIAFLLKEKFSKKF